MSLLQWQPKIQYDYTKPRAIHCYRNLSLDLSFVIRILAKMGYRVTTILHIWFAVYCEHFKCYSVSTDRFHSTTLLILWSDEAASDLIYIYLGLPFTVTLWVWSSFTLELPLLTILYYNARSLFPKIDKLTALCMLHNPGIVCVVETWLSPDMAAHY